MNQLESSTFFTFSGAIGAEKLGQPVPESNLVSAANSGIPQHTQR